MLVLTKPKRRHEGSHIEKPKNSGKRGPRSQHSRVKGLEEVRALSAVFGPLPPDENLYPFGRSAFGSRWNRVQDLLGVPKELRWTLGGLRAGGTVQSYFDGEPIEDIMWELRVRSKDTLQHYLQETAAVSSLSALPRHSRDCIALASRFYPVALTMLKLC